MFGMNLIDFGPFVPMFSQQVLNSHLFPILCIGKIGNQSRPTKLVGGFNPSEKY